MENHADTELIKVGKIGATFGIHGWLKIHTYTEYGASILDYTPWLLLDKDGKQVKTITVEDSHMHSGTLLVKLPGLETPETARLLTGLEVAIPRSRLPVLEEGEFYWSDLEGMQVYNANHELLGTVTYLMETGSNDVLVVTKDGKEHAIPYRTGTVIKRVDKEKREIHVDWELL